MIVVDTSALVESLAGPHESAARIQMRYFIEAGERMLVPTLVLYEWLRGPRLPSELAAQETLFPSHRAIVFGPREASTSAEIYRALRRPRGREIDIAIAACALVREAALWTLNRGDFADIPQLRLAAPSGRAR